jgi:diguanylate cyclase (GGDEF)-like protein/PAS domain S-box-containing protein
MQQVSKDSLQWKAAINTFNSILIAGLLIISLSLYFILAQSDNAYTIKNGLFIYLGSALTSLILVASIFATRAYRALKNSIQSLEQVTNTLPLISQKKYAEAHRIFEEIDDEVAHKEINRLKFATLQLTKLLEKLDLEVHENHKVIQKQNETLDLDRKFIRGLLDTAQLIILTINENFEITLFNDHGERVTGFNREQVLKSHVSRMFPAGNWTEAESFFIELLANKVSIAQQDAELIDHNNEIKHISWLHSRIKESDGKSAILSVGLDMTEKKATEKHVIWLAEHDPLTDLCNRRKFTADFEKSIQMAIRYEHTSSLIIIDLDHFKDINDTCGHKMGDDVLKSVAKTLKKITRFTDLVARIGGDEFAVVMPETDQHGAETLAEKIITHLSQINVSRGQFTHKLSASAGIVHYPLSNIDANQLLSFADLAMYKAKASGKGTYRTFSPDDQMQQQLQSRVFWKHQIEEALENSRFVLFLQPIMRLHSDTIEHYEVLLRMRAPKTDELVMPAKFIEVAEQTGLIHQIDHWVLNHSIQKLAELHQQGRRITLSINLSGAIIDDPVIVPLIKQLIQKYQVNPSYVIFEVTETLAVSNLLQANKIMQAIKALGCRFSLDDFGVGFSSFDYMRQLPVDIIKIDGIFIKNLDKNADDRLFVKALVDVAKGLGKKTIAEFVENEDILKLLRTFGVDYAQGYHVGKPQPELLAHTDWVNPESR